MKSFLFSFIIIFTILINVVHAQERSLEDGKEKIDWNTKKVVKIDSQNLDEMKETLKSVNLDLLDFIGSVKDSELQKKYSDIFKAALTNYKYFLEKVNETTKEMQGSPDLYREQLGLGRSFNLLLERRFKSIEEKLKKAETLLYYRAKDFERAIYMYLRARIQYFNYENSLKAGVPEEDIEKYKERFNAYLSDFAKFIAYKKALYERNSVYYKRVFLIDDSGNYVAKESQSFGDPNVLLEFLKGRFKDYQGIYAQVATFNKSEYAKENKKGIILMMRYQPISKETKITNKNNIQVIVQGDNLEDILSFMINQASKLKDMKASSNNSVIKISTQNAKYSQMIKESLLLSQTAILKAKLISKQWKKIKTKDGEKQVLEATLQIYTGTKPPVSSEKEKKEPQKNASK